MRTGCLSVLLLFLTAQLLLSKVCCSPKCNNQCCRFVESFPGRLRRLREDYVQIRDFYEANDDLDTVLLDQTIEDSFKTPFACNAMNTILEFYLGTVLPAAITGVSEDTSELRPYVESIHLIFDELKRDVTKCRKYFGCQKQFDVVKLNMTYTQMENKGVYKAMGELDVLFNYIEIYLASKRLKNQAVSL
ncbi:interleukin-10 [Syngnathus typhle]|uniref:interleukin-10 n=1 Tax=Syngnathus typhle TaxID=161592 RepID=UPI002A6A72CC|nr:interleukin-10 [Syngnathus typhle]